jgi:prepilin-type N-terminal cleavage/methylation domain-containing protein
MQHQGETSIKGFTLVETLVAVTIITIVLVAPFQLVENSLTSSYVARDELTANSLAQEGIEYALHLRANDYLFSYPSPSTDWLNGLSGISGGADCRAPRVCVLDPSQNLVQACAGNNCSSLPLYINPSTYIYTQQVSGNRLSRFTRTIQVCFIGGASCTTQTDEAKVTVTVTWSTSHQTYTTTVVEYLRNWL